MLSSHEPSSLDLADRLIYMLLHNISLTFAIGSAKFAVFKVAPTITAVHFALRIFLIFELDSIHTLKLTIAQNGGKVKKRVKTEDSVH